MGQEDSWRVTVEMLLWTLERRRRRTRSAKCFVFSCLSWTWAEENESSLACVVGLEVCDCVGEGGGGEEASAHCIQAEHGGVGVEGTDIGRSKAKDSDENGTGGDTD